jgi:uncharacterized protein YeaO (DUF488 family)
VAAEIRTRRWNDPAEPGDGTRILVTRYRPRGVSKAEETWDVWMRHLAPSAELVAAFYGKGPTKTPVTWPAYRATYLREMCEQRDAIADLARRVAGGETLTLLCSSACEREARCHRSLLRELIEAELAKSKA